MKDSDTSRRMLMLRGCCATLAIVVGSGNALAQTAATPGQPTAAAPTPAPREGTQNNDTAIPDIVVTAQLRQENLQQVPISAQVISGNSLTQTNINNLAQVSEVVPSVHVSTGGRGNDMYIRGVGSGLNQSFDQSVGQFIDGIYHGRSRTSSATFLDLERVEILRGPQSTFFGNNAIAGAFNIITHRPTRSFEAWARALYGENGHFALEGAAGGPLSDTFSVRVAGTFNGQRGWLDNINLDEHVPRERNLAGRIELAFNPDDRFEALFKAEAGRNRQIGGLDLQTANCPNPPAPFPALGGSNCQAALALGVPMGFEETRIAGSAGQRIDLDTQEYELTLNYHLGDNATLTSITGFNKFNYLINVDLDYTPPDLLNAQIPEDYRQFSQELRVASGTQGSIEYLAGAYFQADTMRFQQNITYSLLTPLINSNATFAALRPFLPLATSTAFSQTERSYALFGSVTWKITNALRLVGGLRGTWVDKRYDWSLFYGTGTTQFGGIASLPTNLQATGQLLGLGVPTSFGGERHDHAWLPSARLQYQITPGTMAYASYARGFKAGGFNGVDNTGVAANLPFAPEHVDAFEIGLKNELFNRRLVFNLAAFRSNYSDLQVTFNTSTGGGAPISFVRNAAESRSQGIEAELQWAISRNFRLVASGSYLDAYYISYTNAGLTQEQAFCRANPANSFCIAHYPGGVGIAQDLSGSRTPFAPKWSGSLTGTFDAPVGNNLHFVAQATGIFTTRYFIYGNGTNDPLVSQGGYAQLNAQLTLESSDHRWAVDVIGKNLNNLDIVRYAAAWQSGAGTTVFQREEPRNIAVQVRLRW